MTTRSTCGRLADNFIARNLATDARLVNPLFHFSLAGCVCDD
jgi:hypothetical protein